MTIGNAHEPNADTRAALNAALGEGQYEIEYRQAEVGTIVVVRTREQPPRTWSSRFSPGTVEAQANGVWQELAERVGKTLGAIEYPHTKSGAATDTRSLEKAATRSTPFPSIPADARDAFDRLLGAHRWSAQLQHSDGDVTRAVIAVIAPDGERVIAEHTAEASGITTADGLWRRIATDLADASDDDETDIAPEEP